MPSKGIFDVISADAKDVEKHMLRVIPRDKKPPEVYSLIWDLLDRGGKRFRPSLCLLSCEAVGGKRADAISAATSIELFHNFTLIHDDIEDNSLLRRGKPTLHLIYGTPLAINAGDGLFMMVWRSILDSNLPPRKNLAASKILLTTFTMVLEGQAAELNWYQQKRWDISERDYFAMVEGKTAALIGGACETGAFLGNGSKKEMAALLQFGIAIGIAFQIQDDVLNIVGDEAKYGKEIGGDISEGKRTLMTIHFLRHAGKDDCAWMIKTHNANTTDRAEIKRAISLLKSTGSVDYAKAVAKKYALRAKAELEKIRKTPASQKLSALADFLIERDY